MSLSAVSRAITREHVLAAIEDFRAGAPHDFLDSRKYDLIHEGERFPPKAILGLAARHATGTLLKPRDFSGGEASTCFAVLRRLGFIIEPKPDVQAEPSPTGAGSEGTGQKWTEDEYSAAIDSYWGMLLREQRGEAYSKSDERAQLLERLPGRSKGSIELRHQNISAALDERGLPWLAGYKPRAHYGPELDHCLDDFLDEQHRQELADSAAVPEPDFDVDEIAEQLTESLPPSRRAPVDGTTRSRPRRAIKLDYAAREARNRTLGAQGERLIVVSEQKRLRDHNREDLAEQIAWVAQAQGDGLGYDIQSFEPDGSPVYIEVKTTRGGREQPFIVTANELACSEETGDSYRLYRVFGLPAEPGYYVLRGSLRKLAEAGALQLKPRDYTAEP